MINEDVPSNVTLDRFIRALFALVLACVALYFARTLLEPIAFALFGIALVWPFQKSIEAKLPKLAALVLTIFLTIFVLSLFVFAIVWSIDDVVHWAFANISRFQSLYVRTDQWLEGYGIFLAEGLKQYGVGTFVSLLQQAATEVNYFIGFCILVFLVLTFGLIELNTFAKRFEELEPSLGWTITQAAADIAKKIRRYMLVRTLMSVLTGVAVFVFVLSMGLDLAFAWGVISFVLNYIPYIGPFIAVVLPVIFANAQFDSWNPVIVIFAGLYAIQFLTGNYFELLVAGKALKISPFVMLVAFFFWGFLWGIPGAFIGLPATIAIFTICEWNPSTRWIAKLLSL
jgi:predicted PurR-regulated permease PerM